MSGRFTGMHWTRGAERIERARPGQLRIVIFAVVTVVMLGLISHGNYAASGDAIHYMVTARSLAVDHDFDVVNDYGDPANIIKEPAGNQVPIAPFLALGIPVLAMEQRRFRVVAAVVLLQILLDAFFWGHPMLQWSEGPGPAPFVEAMLGRSVAALVPVWESLTGPVMLASLLALSMWATLTVTLTRVRPAA
jgi:hypothetical protein